MIMKQSIVAISFVLLVLVFTTTTTLLETVNCSPAAAAPFILNNLLMKENNNKRLNTTTVGNNAGNDNICCLPKLFSLKGTFSQIFPTRNTTLYSVEMAVELSADYINGKIYQKVSYSNNADKLNGKLNNNITTNSIESWEFKMSDTVTISYAVQNGRCTCSKNDPTPQSVWQQPCIPSFQKDLMISKVRIGQYDAMKISGEMDGAKGQVIAFREDPQMSGVGKCWLLSSLSVSQTSSQEQVYYDMIEKVDTNSFKLPSSCPSIAKCL